MTTKTTEARLEALEDLLSERSIGGAAPDPSGSPVTLALLGRIAGGVLAAVLTVVGPPLWVANSVASLTGDIKTLQVQISNLTEKLEDRTGDRYRQSQAVSDFRARDEALDTLAARLRLHEKSGAHEGSERRLTRLEEWRLAVEEKLAQLMVNERNVSKSKPKQEVH